MRKRIMIFLNVILAIVILFIPNRAKASSRWDLGNFYDNLNLDSNINVVIDFLKQYEDDYYVIFGKSGNYYNVGMALKEGSQIGKGADLDQFNYFHKSGTDQFFIRLKKGYYIKADFHVNSFLDNFNQFKSNVLNNNFLYKDISTSYDYALLGSSASYYGVASLIYTNVDFNLQNSNNDDIFYNGRYLETGERVPTYYEHVNNIITINGSHACDSNDKEIEYITIDFGNFSSGNYTYQYGLRLSGGNTSNYTTTWLDQDTIIWHDIDDLTPIGTYNLNVYYDKAVVYARVLQNGQEKAKAAYEVNNDLLPRFLIFSTANIAQINEYNNTYYTELVTFNIDNVYNPNYLYEYSWDGRTWHSLPFAEGETRCSISNYLQLMLYIRIVDENDNVLYQAYADRTQDDIRNYDSNRFSVKYNEAVACDSNGNDIINVRINLTNITTFTHQYGFRVIINGDTYYNLPLYETILNNNNLITSYNVKIYIDTFKIFEETYNVGNLESYDNVTFEELYNKVQQDVIDDFNANSTSNIAGATDLIMRFLDAIGSFVAGFFDLTIYFYNKLNSWLRAYILATFTIFIICKIVKVARKK